MVRTVYFIYSLYTGAPYIDEKRNAYIFLKKGQADRMAGKLRKVTVARKECDGKQILSYCYAAGARYIRFQGKQIEITEKMVERRFYNGDPNADISRYAHTKNRAYLEDLKNCSFIVPVRIRNFPCVSVEYAAACRNRESEQWYFFAFTDVDEYKKVFHEGAGYEPLRVDFGTLRRIGKQHGFVLNARGMKLIMDPDLLRDIERGRRGG